MASIRIIDTRNFSRQPLDPKFSSQAPHSCAFVPVLSLLHLLTFVS